MRDTRRGKRRHNPPSPAAPAAEQQLIVTVGAVQHPTTQQYQVWVHARGQTVMLLAYRTAAQAHVAVDALRAALQRGDYSTPKRWRAAVATVGADADGQLEPVTDAVFAAIAATVSQGAPTYECAALSDAPGPGSHTIG